MTATNDLNYREREGGAYGYAVLAGQKIFGRAVVGITAAKAAVPAGHANAVKLIGLAEERADNTNGATGDVYVRVKKGVFLIPLAAAVSDIGAAVYASADDTFTLTAGSLLQIGTVHAVDADGTWLKIS
jgi:predicted RecA/RadA family phage recombinase